MNYPPKQNRLGWGTRQIFSAVIEGHPFAEIADVYEIRLQQLIAILQFAAEGAAPSSPDR